MAGIDLNLLKEQIKQAELMTSQFEKQSKMFESSLDNMISSLSGDDKDKIIEFKKMSERAMNLAKEGGDYLSAINEIKDKFKAT